MCNGNELSLVGVLLYVVGEHRDVDLVERRLDLVEDTEGRGVNVENSEEQGDTYECLLTAGEKRKILDYLSGRCDVDVDTAVENVIGIGEHQLCVTAAEKLTEYALERRIDLSHYFNELSRHFTFKYLDGILEFFSGLGKILKLTVHIVIFDLSYLKFLDRVGIDVTDLAKLFLKLGESLFDLAAVRGGYRGIVKSLGVGEGKLVFVKKVSYSCVVCFGQVFDTSLDLGVLV